jgi:hypothetical protein
LVGFLKSDLAIKHEVRKNEIAFRDSLVDRHLAVDVYMRVVEGSTSDLQRKFDEGDRKHEVNQGASKYAEMVLNGATEEAAAVAQAFTQKKSKKEKKKARKQRKKQAGAAGGSDTWAAVAREPLHDKVGEEDEDLLFDGAFNGDNRPREAFAESDKREGRDSLFGRTCLLTGSKEFPEEINKVAPIFKRSEDCGKS